MIYPPQGFVRIASVRSAHIVDETITSADIKDAEIVNADIAANAAIAKSKLAPLAITNADVDNAAAIAKSKLAALNIGDSDVATHTSTKITITAKSQLNAEIHYKDETANQTLQHAIAFAANKNLVGKSQTDAPTLTELPAGQFMVVKETTGSTVKLYYNDGGTLKSVALV